MKSPSLVIAEVGEVSRFPSARHLASWARLTPRVRNSGERVRLGSISHQGSPYLRWGLIQAAQTAVRAEGPLKSTYERIKHRRGARWPRSPSPAKLSPRALRTDTLAPQRPNR
jgi:transposase